jgi:hypothetical protein
VLSEAVIPSSLPRRSVRWRHQFLATKPQHLSDIVEAGKVFILKSAKGSRQLVGRAPRKRGGKPTKTGTSPDDYEIIHIARDRSGATTDHILHDLTGPTTTAVLKPLVAEDVVLVRDGLDAYASFASAENILHISIIASHGEHVNEGFHTQNVSAYTSRLKAWMRPFSGVGS